MANVTVTARDQAGNVATVSKSYTVTSTPVGPKSMIGLSAKREEWDAEMAKMNPAKGVTARRIFCDLRDGARDNEALIREAIADGMMPILSYKVGTDAAAIGNGSMDAAATACGAFLASLGVEVRFVIHHEPYGDLTGPAFVTINKRLAPLMKSTKVKAGSFINGWLLVNREDDFVPYIPNDVVAVWDWIGIDAYHAGSMASPDPTNTPGLRIRKFLDLLNRRGITKKVGIGEYNAFSAAAVSDAGDTILANPIIEFACMWSSQVDETKPDFRLTGARLTEFNQTLADNRTLKRP